MHLRLPRDRLALEPILFCVHFQSAHSSHSSYSEPSVGAQEGEDRGEEVEEQNPEVRSQAAVAVVTAQGGPLGFRRCCTAGQTMSGWVAER